MDKNNDSRSYFTIKLNFSYIMNKKKFASKNHFYECT